MRGKEDLVESNGYIFLKPLAEPLRHWCQSLLAGEKVGGETLFRALRDHFQPWVDECIGLNGHG